MPFVLFERQLPSFEGLCCLRSPVQLSLSKEDINGIATTLGWRMQLQHWRNPDLQYAPLYAIDPQCTFRIPHGLSRQTECAIHRLRLKVAYTKTFLNKIGLMASPLCTLCGVREDTEHLFCVCPRFNSARTTARSLLRARTVSMEDFFGPWNSEDRAVRGFKALARFLRDSGLDSSL